jgi:Na+-driven multidrug efflux pump
MFQALGNTIPSLASSFIRTTLLVVPAIMMSHAAGFSLRWIWLLAVGCTTFHALLNVLLLRREYRRRLTFAAPVGAETAVPQSVAAAAE